MTDFGLIESILNEKDQKCYNIKRWELFILRQKIIIKPLKHDIEIKKYLILAKYHETFKK